MAVITKGHTFANGDQVTAVKLNNLADDATFASGAVDNVSTQLSGGSIIVKDGGVSTAKLADTAVTTAKITDGNVTKAKIENVADMKVLGNTSGSAAAPQEVSVLDEDDMTSDSATALATQQSIKAYVDATAQSEAQTAAMQYSGSTGTIAVTSSFSDLDLSSIVGSNRAFIVMEVTCDTTANIFLRSKGSSISHYFGASNAGFGASGVTGHNDTEGGTVCVVSDSNGVVEILSQGTSTNVDYTVQAYQVLQ